MDEMCFKPLIEDMTWSYSRVSSFDSCPGAWFYKYIRGHPEEQLFYSSFGKLVHDILEKFYKGKIKKEDMLFEFLTRINSDVKGERPEAKILDKYINGVSEYLNSFAPFPYEMIDVEKYVSFMVEDKRFVGVIDYIGMKDGEYYIIDNKSGDLRKRSNRKYPTIKDMELDEKLRQLYLYAEAINQEYGKYPAFLCFNCFRTGVFIKEPFSIEKYNETKQWALEEIEKIENEEYFVSVPDYFRCKWLCGYGAECEEYQEYLAERRRGRR